MKIFAGPCVIESETQAVFVAQKLAAMGSRLGVEIIYKSSFDKANRSSEKSARGPGLEDGLAILAEIKAVTGLRIITDIHEADQAEIVAQTADIIQIPAFLCRQTDLLQAAVRTGRPVLVKKGQFLSPQEMAAIVGKAKAAAPNGELGPQSLMLCERGTSFGYNDLVVDMRSLEIMRGFGFPVIFDATHSVQRPGANISETGETQSGGNRQMIPALARAAAAVGIDGLFIETHPDPENAKSDAASVWPLGDLEQLLSDVLAIDRTIRRTIHRNDAVLSATG